MRALGLQIKYSVLTILLFGLCRQICAVDPPVSGSAAEGAQSEGTPSVPEFKTTFENDLINLDINCRHGYGKFSCTVQDSEVKYQSEYKFIKVSDDDTKIWKKTDNNAYRVISHFFDGKPLTASVHLEPGDDTKVFNYRRKCGTQEWEPLSKQDHDGTVEKLLEELKKHRDPIEEGNQSSIDLVLKFKNNGVSFEVKKYKDKDPVVSGGTKQAKSSNHQVDSGKYSVQDQAGGGGTEGTPGGGADQTEKSVTVTMTDKLYRIVEVKYDPGSLNSTKTVWESGGHYFAIKVTAMGTKDKLTKFDFEFLDRTTGQRVREVYEFKKMSWYQSDVYDETLHELLPTFDFSY